MRRFLDIIGWSSSDEHIDAVPPLDTLAVLHARHDRTSVLTLAQVHRLFDVFNHLLRLWRAPELGRLDGPTVFFEATRGTARRRPLHRHWQPHVACDMTVHRIDCAHDDMVRPAALATIGGLLKDVL